LLVKQFKYFNFFEKNGKIKIKNVITYADGLAFCADGMSMPTIFLAILTPA
jgi:hypothetical protein